MALDTRIGIENNNVSGRDGSSDNRQYFGHLLIPDQCSVHTTLEMPSSGGGGSGGRKVYKSLSSPSLLRSMRRAGRSGLAEI
jgi:hypothetical protein